MFQFTQEPLPWSQSQCLAKITGMVPLWLYWSHFTSLSRPPLPLFTTVGIYRQNTDNARIDKHSGTIPVILARHWLLLPDDGSCVNWNMLEQLLYF